MIQLLKSHFVIGCFCATVSWFLSWVCTVTVTIVKRNLVYGQPFCRLCVEKKKRFNSGITGNLKLLTEMLQLLYMYVNLWQDMHKWINYSKSNILVYTKCVVCWAHLKIQIYSKILSWCGFTLSLCEKNPDDKQENL